MWNYIFVKILKTACTKIVLQEFFFSKLQSVRNLVHFQRKNSLWTSTAKHHRQTDRGRVPYSVAQLSKTLDTGNFGGSPISSRARSKFITGHWRPVNRSSPSSPPIFPIFRNEEARRWWWKERKEGKYKEKRKEKRGGRSTNWNIKIRGRNDHDGRWRPGEGEGSGSGSRPESRRGAFSFFLTSRYDGDVTML